MMYFLSILKSNIESNKKGFEDCIKVELDINRKYNLF